MSVNTTMRGLRLDSSALLQANRLPTAANKAKMRFISVNLDDVPTKITILGMKTAKNVTKIVVSDELSHENGQKRD